LHFTNFVQFLIHLIEEIAIALVLNWGTDGAAWLSVLMSCAYRKKSQKGIYPFCLQELTQAGKDGINDRSLIGLLYNYKVMRK
jgi:hypothetical protein